MTVAAAGSDRRGRLRLFAILCGLYLAQSIPSYLIVAAIPPIMREQGVSRSDIGMISALMLPLVLKFLWAPQVDRFRPLARRHRSGWVLLTQGAIILCLATLSLIAPTDVTAFLIIGFALAVLLSTQDIATDGYAAKYLDPRDRPIGNAIQGGATAIGVVLGGTLGLVVYHHAGWTTMIATVAALSLIPLAAAFFMREDDPASSAGTGSRPSIRRFLARPDTRLILAIALIYRASEGLVKAMEGPYLVDSGVALDTIGYLSGGAAATAGLLGSAVAAVLSLRLGVGRVLILLGLMRSLCFLTFTIHALGIIEGLPLLFGAAAFQTLIRYMEIVALYSLFMAVTSSDQPGTDFTILACAQLVVYLAGSFLSGMIADGFGYDGLFMLATGLSILATLAVGPLIARTKSPA
ncbi:MFS transporter [Zavarzinia compransoris]|uniref:MFS transporter n=1 Tax=Zavarzinia marina TaxID=2911065 RepID=UPI001F3CF90B|nr:MFS transporter [Zavarzinia marina]MCF4166587.1 MFS transporter [Zavarzinia marina]